MLRACLVMILAVQAALCFPQVTLSNEGQVGVNFGGYHAEAGLGESGGLSASAGTPNGQNAKAGIGGSTSGGAFAEANAGEGVGASAVLKGQVNGNQYISETGAHADTNTVYTKKVVYTSNTDSGSANYVKQWANTTPPPQQDNIYSVRKTVIYPVQDTNTYTKTKQVRYQPVETYRKTYRFRPYWSKKFIYPIQPEPVAERLPSHPVESSNVHYRKEVQVNGNGSKQGLFDAIFQIPIATLKAVNNLVNQATSGGAVYTKSVHPVAERLPSHPVESSTVHYRKEVQVNGNGYIQGLFDAIFQIPIATLKEVNNVVNQATSGSAVYTKSVHVN